ncbi:dTMP kinase [Candidatus Kaiserbacteria bacterium]|nr:dTMP kinase [Candidatus Kaiserbacteria bacterium]
MKGKLVVFEGIDGAGKATQLKLLEKKLRREGKSVKTFRFPRYEHVVGQFIKECLAGKHGDFLKLDAYFTAFPYVTDRILAAPQIRAALKKSIVLTDRYTPSNFAFGGAKVRGSLRAAYLKFFEELEYGDAQLPRPDLVLYLDTHVETAQKQLKRSGKKLDVHERARAYQKEVATLYKQLARGRNWRSISCKQGESPAKIHEKIWKAVRGNIR